MSKTEHIKKNAKALSVKNERGYLNYINYIMIAYLSVILTVAPFYRGLYFRENYMPAMAFIGVVFTIMTVKLIKDKGILIENYIDIAFLGFIIAYFISFIFGISKSNSLDGFIKYLAAFMIYKIAYELTRDSKIKEYLLDAIVISGFATALFSLLGSGGIVNINGVFGWGERLNGLYQYPNSTASILGGIFLLNVFLLMNKKNRHIRIAYYISASTLMLTFLETRSRGGMLTLLVAWIFSFIFSQAKDKLLLIVYSGTSVAVSFLFYSRIYSTFIEQKNFMIVFGAFLVASVAFGFVLELLVKQVQRLETKNINRIFIVIFVVIIIAGIAAFTLTTPLELTDKQPQRGYEIYQVKPSTTYRLEFGAASLSTKEANLSIVINSVDRARVRTNLTSKSVSLVDETVNSIEFTTNDSTFYITVDFINQNPVTGLTVNECTLIDGDSGAVIEKLKLNYRFIPNDIAKKINEISLKTESSSERIVFIKDGLKIFKDYSLTGTGAKGWWLLYTKYQSYGYVSREAHNYYLQTAIESGILGFISLVVLLICIAIAGLKLYIGKKENTYLLIGVASMLFELLAHAFLDFDFSLYAIFLVLVSCIGWLSSIATQNGVLVIKINKGRNLQNYIALAFAVILAIVTATMYSGMKDGAKAAKIINTDTAKAKEYYESAMKKDFFNSAYMMDYNQILTMEAQKNPDKLLIEKIYKNYKTVEKNDPYEAIYYPIIMNFYAMFGYFDDAAALAERLIEIQPIKQDSYELKANLNYQIMGYFLNKKDYKEALKYNDAILEIEKQHAEANEKTIAPFELNENTKKIIIAAKASRLSIESIVK